MNCLTDYISLLDDLKHIKPVPKSLIREASYLDFALCIYDFELYVQLWSTEDKIYSNTSHAVAFLFLLQLLIHQWNERKPLPHKNKLAVFEENWHN